MPASIPIGAPSHLLYGYRSVLIAILLLLLTGPCEGQDRLPAGSLPVPLFRQATNYSCGAAVLQAVLSYWGVYDGREDQLYGPLGTTEVAGTDPAGIVRVARQYGLTATLREYLPLTALRRALAQGETVIINLQAWRDPNSTLPWSRNWEDGHYVVLVAMDSGQAYVMDPSTSAAYTYLPLNELVARWHDYNNRQGFRREYHHAAIFIHGKRPATRYPLPLVRLK
ncbi:MAG: C39 family peptidase [Candidatus Competibacteraceae bacterium]